MADDVVKRLLIKLGIDGTDASNFVQKLQDALDRLYEAEKSKSAERKRAQQDDAAAMAKQAELAKQQVDISNRQVANLRAQLEAKQVTVKQIQEEIAKERNKLDIQSSTLKVMAAQGDISAAAVKTLEKQIALERQKLALQQAQLRATGMSAGRGEGGSLAGEVLRSAGRGLFGGGMLGNVANISGAILGGGLVGGAAVEGVQMLMEGIRELGKALVEAMGPAQNLRMEFEKLASAKGINPANLLQNLREATRGLIADMQLYQTANVFLRSNMKLSNDQMLTLVRTTVDLARLNGHTAPEAMNALNLAFERGQPFVLARVTGLTTLQRQLLQLPRGIDPAVAATVRMNTVLHALEDAAKKSIIPVTTLPDLFSQFGVVWKNFAEGVAEGVLKTGSLQKAIQELSKFLIDSMPAIVEFAKGLGEKIGGAILVGTQAIRMFAGEIKLLWSVLSGVVGLFSALVTHSTNASKAFSSGIGPITNFRQAMGLLALAAENVGHSFKKSATMVKLFFEILKGGGQKAIDQATGELGKESAAHEKTVKDITGYVKGVAGEHVGSVTTTQSKFVDTEGAKRAAVLRAEIRREQAKVELQIAKDEIDAENELLKTKYQMGLLDLEAYLAQETALRKREHDERAEEIKAEGAAQKQAARAKIQPTITPDGQIVQVSNEEKQAEAQQEVLIDQQTKLKLLENDDTFNKQRAENALKALEDRKAAEKTYQQALISLQKEGLAEQQSLLEKQFKQGEVSPDDYINKRRTMIEEEGKMVQDELAQELADTAKSEAEKAQIRVKGIQAALASQKQLTDFDQQQEQIRVQATEAAYARTRADLQARQAAAQLGVQQRTPGAHGDEVSILEKMVEENQKYIQQLNEEALSLHNQPTLWAQTIEKIKQATDEQIKLNQQLRDARNFAKPLAELMGAVGGALGQAGLSHAAEVVGSMQGSLQQFSEFLAGGGGGLGSLFGRKKGSPAAKTGTDALKDSATQAAASQRRYSQELDQSTAKLRTMEAQEEAAKKAAGAKLSSDLEAVASTFKGSATTTAQKIDLLGNAAAAAASKMSGHGLGQGEGEGEGGEAPNVQAPPGAAPTITSSGLQMPTLQASQPPSIGSTSGDSGGGSGGDQPQNIVDLFHNMMSKSTGALKDFIGAIDGAVSSVGNFIGALKGAKSGAGGALSGGLAGMGMGAQIGSMAGPMGGVIGAAVGGIGGAITGGIMGAKEAKVKQDVKIIQDQLQSIVDQLHDGTMTIAQSIAALRQERETAIKMLSGTKGAKGKKGQPSQLQTVLQQIDSQLSQILAQQQQLFDQMDESILEMSQGIYWQPVITQLDQIVKQYQQFASAAQGNAAQVAAANEYLTQSLQNYSQTMQETFLADQEQAIQNALQLLQLEQEQAEMANQYQSQVYGILSQGVTSRQLSGAQTKGAEIEAMNQQYSQQQQQLQQEIAVAQYKYNIQQKIFGLASTQVGLEMELVAVQDAQANNSMQSVLVLQQAMLAINAALASGNLPSLLTGALSTGGQGLAGILQLLGITVPNVPGLGANGGINYLSEITGAGAQFQGIIQSMQQTDPNFLLDVIQAMMTPAGSAQRQNLINLINNPQFGLGTDAIATYGQPFLDSFEQWISSGAPLPAGTPLPPAQPGGYQEGTVYVPQTGIAQLEQGEAVIPADMNPWADAGGGVPFNQQSVNNSTSAALSDANLQVEQQIYQLVMARVSAEWQLVQAKIQLMQLQQNNQPGGVASFEGGLAQVYEQRGRYGSGGVRTEYL